MATFIPPLSYERMLQRWESFLAETTTNSRVIIISLSPVSERHGSGTELMPPFDAAEWPVLAEEPKLEVSGVISLSLPASETGPFRANVQNLFVSRFHRRRGTASALMLELEEQARKNDRWNLILDTTVGTGAEQLYPKLGWERLGVVREYGISPKDGRLLDEVFFWKDIRQPAHP